MMAPSIATVNHLNSLMIFLSAVAAYYFPLEVFLLSYLFLGPFHYLTEINWLKDRNFYISKSSWKNFVLIGAMMISLPFFYEKYRVFALLLFVIAVFVVMNSNWPVWSQLICIGLSIFFYTFDLGKIVFGGLFLTFIHVHIFTMLFLFAGFKRQRDISSALTLLIFIGTSVFFIFHDFTGSVFLSKKSWDYLQFLRVDWPLRQVWGMQEGYPQMIEAMRLLSFAYLYHYLNWFSKTNIIGWHKISTQRLMVMGVIVGIIFSLYFYNVELGIRFALFFSIFHVLVELPLNMLVVKKLFATQ